MLRIVRGLPGSGKSSFARYFFPGVFHVENDMGHINKYEEYHFDKDRVLEVQMWCHDTVRLALQNNIECVVSNVFVSKRSVDSYVLIAKECGTDFVVYRTEGMFQNEHNVPYDVYQSMKEKFENYPDEIIIKPETMDYWKIPSFLQKK